MADYKFIVWLNEEVKDPSILGGKGANLNKLMLMGVPVPPGFVITTEAFNYFMSVNGLRDRVLNIINEVVKEGRPEEYEEAERRIKGLILNTEIPRDLHEEITRAYMELSKSFNTDALAVAVRSSASAEDLRTSSFAGQQDTYLNVRGVEDLIKYVKYVWASTYNARALAYRDERDIPHDVAYMAVIVQKLVNSKAAGVLFTINPVTGDSNEVVIESSWGLGEAVVGGMVTPDRWVVDKSRLVIKDRVVARKSVMMTRSESGLTKVVEVPSDLAEKPSLSDAEVIALAKLGIELENRVGYPLDIEWVIDSDSGNIYVVQMRPETVYSSGKAKAINEGRATTGKAVIKGIAASPGIAVGRVRICLTPEEARAKMGKGDILVTKMTNPDWVPYMKMASAIITDEGGMTSHAAIVSRELGIPAIVGTGNATSVLKDGEVYTVDAVHGVIYEGKVEELVSKAKATREVQVTTAPSTNEIILHIYRSIRTATGVYMNLGVPEKIDEYKDLPFDGIGLMRIEFVLSSYIGDHPLYLISIGNEEKFINRLAEGVAYVAKAIYPRPVIVRFSDFKSNEYRQLTGGEKFEPEERNPMLGWRGVSRYISKDYEKAFRLEVRAIKRVREEMNLNNVHVMVPFVRAPWELERFMQILNEEGLERDRDFKVYAMAEIPSIALLVEDFAKYVDGFSIGSNDLTQLIMGVDRDNDILVRQNPRYFDEREPAVLRAMYEIIRRAHAMNKSVGICGQAPSVYPEITEFLVRAGIDYVSVNPDAVITTRLLIDSIERKIILEELRELRRKLMPMEPDGEFHEILNKVFKG
ncbi:phosphoenolpyruvate synthase [Vulcanisaeta distributa]|uniref:Phosphoenolpyruvate synthase n=1 Tax=Vulcanisaeta distributa (strain DSM 14429 / JCM 11212 / NBRC 100878 / IC-017) TaxID=572478 RepID=E1QT50_VULDI|nr:phosphoenolpyruvate synthase [Vulcanisaeta distributa]ADN49642.1 phosphoenolpyruvate synthase [Vulcanisaeta distributa DSM 14429]